MGDQEWATCLIWYVIGMTKREIWADQSEVAEVPMSHASLGT